MARWRLGCGDAQTAAYMAIAFSRVSVCGPGVAEVTTESITRLGVCFMQVACAEASWIPS